MNAAADAAVKALSSCLFCLLRIPSKNLKASYVYQDKTEKYIDMLKECFGISIDIDSNTVGICEECVGRLRDASNFKVQVQRCQVQLQRLMRKAIRLLQEEEEPVVKSEIADDDGTSDNLLASAPLPPEMADGGAPRQESASQEAPEVKWEMPSEEDEAADETRRNYEKPAALWEMFDDDGTNIEAVLRERQRTCGGGPLLKAETCACAEDAGTSDDIHPLSARARQQLAMTCVVRLERLRQSQCQPCHVATDHEASLTTHMKDMHTDSAGLRAEEEACTCDTCGEQFADEMDLVDHVQTHMETTYSCKICSLEFSCKIIFSKHSRTHKTPKVYSCKICSKVFSSKCNLNAHGAVHTGLKPYSCDMCNKCFTRKGTLMDHIRIHTGQKPYECEMCNKRFSLKSNLKKHFRIHTGQKPFKCELCNKVFTESSSLKRHTIIHTGQKPYKCEICNKEFTRNSHLVQHIRIHTGQNLYKCDMCNKRFTQKGTLKSHIRIHTGHKPYKCEICNKQFTRKSDLHSHMNIHTGQKPYKCEICNKQFTDKRNLHTHMRIHTGLRPYKCEICNKRFTLKSNLNRHMRVHAGQKP